MLDKFIDTVPFDPALITLIGGVLAAISAIRIFRQIAWMALLGGLLAVAGSFLQNAKSDKDMKAKAAEYLLAIKQSETASTKETWASNTGGDSWFYVDAWVVNSSKFMRVIEFNGKYPMHDVEIVTEISDADPNTPDNKRVLTTFHESFSSIDRQTFLNRLFEIPDIERIKFNITIEARNGLFVEELYYRRINNKWTKAIILTKAKTRSEDGTMKPVTSSIGEPHRIIDPDFPINELQL